MSQVPGLLMTLGKEIRGSQSMEGFIDELQMFNNRRTEEEFVGLEEKLEKADRKDQILDAKQKWEQFQKLLQRYQHYPSAQKLFAFFLARINDVFENHICPHQAELSRREVDKIIEEKIVLPTIADMGSGFEHFTLTHAHIRGMIYWLADRCFVRWH